MSPSCSPPAHPLPAPHLLPPQVGRSRPSARGGVVLRDRVHLVALLSAGLKASSDLADDLAADLALVDPVPGVPVA